MSHVSIEPNNRDRYIAPMAAVSGFMAVALGAFGTHGLKDRLTPDMLAIWHTGVEYHLAHSLAALLAGVFYASNGHRLTRLAGWLFLIGNLIFGGSLYLLAVTGVRTLGAVTPLGGLAYLAGWVLLAVSTAA